MKKYITLLRDLRAARTSAQRRFAWWKFRTECDDWVAFFYHDVPGDPPCSCPLCV